MRTLTITISHDWQNSLKAAGRRLNKAIHTGTYQGESLSFDKPSTFFSNLTEKRWNIMSELLGHKTLGVRELARSVKRDVKRVHEDAQALVELGLLVKNESGSLSCPYDKIHIDVDMLPRKVA